jgi:phage-related protein
MANKVAYSGLCLTIEFATLPNGTCPGQEFFSSLDERWQAQLIVQFKRLGDTGRISNREKFKRINTEFWEFKCFKIRMPCYYRSDRRVVITHGFAKKADNIPRGELLRAQSIKEKYEAILASKTNEGERIQ